MSAAINTECPTLIFRNRVTGRQVVINESEYNDGRYMYLTNLSSLNNWRYIGKHNAGGENGYVRSREIGDIAEGVKRRRSKDKLGQKIKFSSI